LEDRLVRGFWAGVIAAIPMNLVSIIVYYVLHFTELMLWDYGAIMLYGHRTAVLWQRAFAGLAQLMFSGLVGVLFAYFLTKVTSKSYLFKGWFFSNVVWFTVFTVGSLFRVPHLYQVYPGTAVTNFVSASVYGLTLAYILYLLDNRIKAQ